MKVRLVDPLAVALRRLTQSVDSATGRPYQFRSLDRLKADCRLEDVVAFCLEQEPANPGSNRLKFVCIWHDDHNPSLWVNVEEQRWGCHAGCYSSGDVLDFVQKMHDLDYHGGVDWLKVWATYHAPGHERGYITVRVARGRR